MKKYFLLLLLVLIISTTLSSQEMVYPNEKVVITITDKLPSQTRYVSLEIFSSDDVFISSKRYDLLGGNIDVFFTPYSFFDKNFYVDVVLYDSQDSFLSKITKYYYLEENTFSLDIYFCKTPSCNYFYQSSDFNLSDDIYINNKNNIENILYDVVIFRDQEEYASLSQKKFPLKLDLESGLYSFYVKTYYNNKLFESLKYVNTINVSSETNDKEFTDYLISNDLIVDRTIDDINKDSKSFNIFKIWYIYLIVILIVIFIIFKRLRKTSDNNLINRRERRHL